jgi:hypothetical protein
MTYLFSVTPAQGTHQSSTLMGPKAGVHAAWVPCIESAWMPAFAGMTNHPSISHGD